MIVIRWPQIEVTRSRQIRNAGLDSAMDFAWKSGQVLAESTGFDRYLCVDCMKAIDRDGGAGPQRQEAVNLYCAGQIIETEYCPRTAGHPHAEARESKATGKMIVIRWPQIEVTRSRQIRNAGLDPTLNFRGKSGQVLSKGLGFESNG
jgi:hypothetical protein